MNKEIKIEVVTGKLNTFIIEPFIPHLQSDEYYINIHSSIFFKKKKNNIYYYS